MTEADHDPVFSLLRGILALARRMRTSRSPGSRTLSGLGILGTLHRMGPLVSTQLAAAEGLQPQSLTRVLAELEDDLLISRKRNDADGRAVTITLTAKGRRLLLEEITARRSWLEGAMVATLTPTERDTAHSAAAVLLKIASYQPQGESAMKPPSQPRPGPLVANQDLSGATYTNIKLAGAAFNDVNLGRSSFDNVNLADATFSDVNLTNVSIRDARLDGMTINGKLVSTLLRNDREGRPQRGETGVGDGRVGPSNAVFHVSSLSKSLNFYVQTLGFALEFKFGKPASYAGLTRENVHLHISSSYPYKNNTGHGNLYIQCGDIDAFYERLDSAGVQFYSRIGDREYGMRDFAVKDPDGNQIGFGLPIKASST